MASQASVNIDDAFSTIHDISDADLDELLRLEDSARTLSSITVSAASQASDAGNGDNDRETVSTQNLTMCSIMRYNRQDFLSQISASQFGGDDVSNSTLQLTQVSNYNDFDFDAALQRASNKEPDSGSLILQSPEIEMISLSGTETEYETEKEPVAAPIRDDTMQFSENASVRNRTLALSSVQGSPNARHLDNSFEQEFAKFQEIDFDDLNFDFEHISQLEQIHTKNKSSRELSKTQINSIDNGLREVPEIWATCPAAFAQDKPGIHPTPSLLRPIQDNNLNQRESKTQNSCEVVDYSRDHAKQQGGVIKEAVLEASKPLNVTSGNNSAADSTMVPPSVKQLYDIIKEQYTDFAFVYALSAQLCQDRVPMDCFVNLKLGLLLSLASIGCNPDRPPIPIVAIGNDAYMCNYLLTNVGQLAARFIGPIDDVRPPQSTVATAPSYIWIEADPIVLAKGGVFYVGDWSRLKAARADRLFKVIECSRVVTERTKHVCPLETAIWAHWRSFKRNARDQQTFNNFVKVFGVPIIVDDANHEVLIDYILKQSSVRLFESTIDHLSISADEMREFLAVISKRTVDLSAEASEILQKYFVASRIERPDCLSKQAFAILKQFAESFAKLAFRHEVTAIDAYAAIFMCENFVQSFFGASENPPPQFESHHYIGSVDEHMVQFKKWLSKYIQHYYDKP